MSVDATSLVYKEALSRIEDAMPGTRIRFYSGFLQERENARLRDSKLRDVPELCAKLKNVPGLFAEGGEEDRPAGTCGECGAPSYTETCSYCRLKEKVRKAKERR